MQRICIELCIMLIACAIVFAVLGTASTIEKAQPREHHTPHTITPCSHAAVTAHRCVPTYTQVRTRCGTTTHALLHEHAALA